MVDMKYSFDLKHNIGKITPESLDDVFLLEKIITPGCLVTAKTLRSKEIRRGEEKIKAKKEPVVLTISVEKTEFHEEKGLRLTGKIVSEIEGIEKAYHSIDVKPNTFLKIEKEWKKWEVDKIKKAKVVEKVLVCILDESEADLYVIKERSKHLLHLTCSLGKESGVSTKLQYFADIYERMKKEDVRYIVIAGPAFAKEELFDYLKENDKEVGKKISLETLAHTGEPGFQELLKRGVLERIIKISRISEETRIVEKLLEEISKDGLVVYGKEETKKAVEMGAVELLLISDKKVREFEELMGKAEKMKTHVMIIESSHQAGDKFLRLGGIGGFLRYRIS